LTTYDHVKEEAEFLMDFNKLTTADRVVGASAIVFLIAFFLPWEGISTDFGSASNSGADYFLTGWIPLLLAIAMVVQIALARFSTTQLPKLPVTWGQAHLIMGAVAAVLVVLRLIVPADEGSGIVSVDLDRMYGLFIATVAAIGLAVGGFLKSKEPEEAFDTGGAVPGGYPGSPPPPPPPGGGSC
jgi:peptidoglycan biosynthesis protein MviN/MurJ (putative lipid II flippase)